MHLSQRFAAIILTLGLSASLVGCGFHLRGTQLSALPQEYQSIRLDLIEKAEPLKKPLSVYLADLGAQVNQPNAATTLRINNYELRRQLFSGKLTEVQLRLSATFSIENAQGEQLTAPRTVIAQRSYQYDIASVNTERQEEQYLIKVMQEDVAQQIVRQLHANRLPQAQIDQAQ
ncbi:LPS assembly lipoprotein LptE [Acinetobacter puyangensis]|uniref:LPS-assembly lipoprotein LptE n=1 Tax=Acinetobacter puyangensis TaxID=1096779 RepID=UPI003A4E63D5